MLKLLKNHLGSEDRKQLTSLYSNWVHATKSRIPGTYYRLEYFLNNKYLAAVCRTVEAAVLSPVI
jgi:hypothetical protein